MGLLKISQNWKNGFTSIPNSFIDEHMADANDAQLKVYLFILRATEAGMDFSLSDLADRFNFTEREVLRSLKFWEKKALLNLEYDSLHNLTGIRLNQPVQESQAMTVSLSAVSSDVATHEAGILQSATLLPKKADYSADQIKEFRNRENISQLLFIAEQYMGRPLTMSDIRTLFYLSEGVGLSDDLLDYLIEYCVERGKRDFRYIEKVGLNWAEAGIKTPKQAQNQSGKYDREVYAVMNALGKSSVPTPKEVEFIDYWRKNLGFTEDIILEACSRTVLATDKHRFEYADGILKSWHKNGVRHRPDISRLDQAHIAKQEPAVPNVSNRFNQLLQNSYDFDALEREVLSN